MINTYKLTFIKNTVTVVKELEYVEQESYEYYRNLMLKSTPGKKSYYKVRFDDGVEFCFEDRRDFEGWILQAEMDIGRWWVMSDNNFDEAWWPEWVRKDYAGPPKTNTDEDKESGIEDRSWKN